jgi:hypothetical protein
MMEVKLALAFLVRELDFDFNYRLWSEVNGDKNTGDKVNGGMRIMLG